jgi:hypothetical protein
VTYVTVDELAQLLTGKKEVTISAQVLGAFALSTRNAPVNFALSFCLRVQGVPGACYATISMRGNSPSRKAAS